MQNNTLSTNFPRLIRYNAAKGSPKRFLMRSQDAKQENSKLQENSIGADLRGTEATFNITDLKIYERQQRENIFDQTHTYPSSPKWSKNQEPSTDLVITQTKLTGRKFNQFSMFDLMPIQIKEFFQGKLEIIKILDDYGIINEQMTHLVQTVKCYRYELGSSLERISSMYFKILEHLLEQALKIFEEGKGKWEREMEENLRTIANLENEMKQMDAKQRNIKNLLGFQESEYKICKMNCDGLQNEVVMLHDLIKTDLQQMIMRIGQLEESRKTPDNKNQASDDPCDKLVYNLHNLSKMLGNLEHEHEEGTEVIVSMNFMLKSMLRGNRMDKYTQVDEGELSAKSTYLITDRKDILLQAFPNEPDLIKSGAVQWNLSKNLLMFLRNVIKNNDSGHVIPWQAFKDMIYNIYETYITETSDVQYCLDNKIVSLDEYLCIHMLKQYKIRRNAELKLLEFLVSLKYHSKVQMRAIMFAKFCGIIPITNQAAGEVALESQITFKLDAYLLNFYLFCFKTVNSLAAQGIISETEEGTQITNLKALDLINTLLPFVPEAQKIKVRKKLEIKQIPISTVGAPDQIVDLDNYYGWLITEYLESKRNQVKSLVKQFTRRVEGDRNSICDFKEFRSVLDAERGPGLPVLTDFMKLRTFFMALTSSQNTNEVTATQMLLSCSINGIDSPYLQTQGKSSGRAGSPFHDQSVNDSVIQPQQTDKPTQEKEQSFQQSKQKISNYDFASEAKEKIEAKERSQTIQQGDKVTVRNQSNSKSIVKKLTQRASILEDNSKSEIKFKEPKDEKDRTINFQQQKYQQLIQNREISKFNTSQITILTQHYSILKELRIHCIKFVDSVEIENNPKKLWREFKEISSIIDAACNFLNFPILAK